MRFTGVAVVERDAGDPGDGFGGVLVRELADVIGSGDPGVDWVAAPAT